MQPTQKTKKARFVTVSSIGSKKTLYQLPYIQLTLSTWQKESHGLYDYEALHNMCQVQLKNIQTSSKIYRHVSANNTLIIDVNDPRIVPLQYIYIGTIIIDRKDKVFKIQSATVSGIQPDPQIKQNHPDIFNETFLAIKSYQKEQGIQGYPLIPGNLVRLGRVEYLVLQIRNESSAEVFKQTAHLELNNDNYTVSAPAVGTCKICLSQQSTEQDPLINPCFCKGSCQLVHVNCLKMWINSKVKKQLSDIVITYNFSKFECQICKAPFPKTVTLTDGRIIEMIQIEKPEKPYMILQSVVHNKQDKKNQRTLHMIFSNEGNSLKVGRGNKCQMRVNDISVSRTHAQIRYQNNKFYIKDLKSKFGTLIQFKQQYDIKNGLMLQYRRLCLQFNMKTEQPKEKRYEVETMAQDRYDQY